jgi:hypothetical protein
MTRLISFVFAVVLFVQPSSASASIIGFSGDGDILVPNATPNTGMTVDFFQDVGATVPIHGWNELQNITLASDITVDIAAPGAYGMPFTSANAVISAGTVISSHYFHQNPESFAGSFATFQFDADIIGIIVLSDLASGDRLLNTDFLRNPLTVAPGAHIPGRGLEFGTDDVLFNVDLRTITLDLSSLSSGDQLRVITQATPVAVPEPSSMLLLGAGLIVTARRLRSSVQKTAELKRSAP